MDKIETDAKYVLNQLGILSSYLSGIDLNTDINDCFRLPLDIMRQAMAFDVSVLYKITNIIDDNLLLEVSKILDPDNNRPDLVEGLKLEIDLNDPPHIFMNEVNAYKTKKISHINVPNEGCDIMGFVFLPESFGGGYLFGGDYMGQEASVRDYEASVCEIICNLLSTILIKTQFEKLAVYDSLTGLYNSRAIREEVLGSFHRVQRKKDMVSSIVLCDIDYFKKINDEYGHIQGDMILKETGLLLENSMRKDFDVAGRYGGEEFILVLEETDGETAYTIVERLRNKIEKYQFVKVDKTGKPVFGKYLNITLSFGIAENRADSGVSDMNEWISRADNSLYASKRGGRNRVTSWSE